MQGTTKQPPPPAAAPAPAVYLPATADRPAEPAPWVLTDVEVARFCRLGGSDVYSALKRYRAKGWLKGTKSGNRVCYRLPDVLAFVNRLHAEDAR